MPCFEPVCIERIEQPEELLTWIPSLISLITPWLSILQDDAQNPLNEMESLYGNLAEQLPYLWIVYTRQRTIIAAASLTQVIEPQYAYIHGVRAFAYRKHPGIRQLTRLVFEEAFFGLQLHKLKAGFDTDNSGALGFCRLYGFTKEAHFKEDNRVQGQYKDVVVYSLFRSVYLQQQEAMNHYGIR